MIFNVNTVLHDIERIADKTIVGAIYSTWSECTEGRDNDGFPIGAVMLWAQRVGAVSDEVWEQFQFGDATLPPGYRFILCKCA